MSDIADEKNEMVRAVANALFAASQEDWPEMARAAIAAMREPTDAMIRATKYEEWVEDAWLAMIDEALK